MSAVLRWPGSVVLFAALVLVGLGCGTSDAGSTGADTRSRLEAAIGIPLEDPDASEAWFNDREVERRELIAACMLRSGFEYSTDLPPSFAVTTDLAQTSREYAQEFGFGIIANFDAQAYDEDRDYSTPNSRYLATLTGPEREAFNTALHGNASGNNRSAFLPEEGCDGEASETAFTELLSFIDVQPDIEALYTELQADPRVVNLNDQWVRCMAAAGYPHDSPEDVRPSFFRNIENLLRSGDVFTFAPGDLPPEVSPVTPTLSSQNGVGGFGVLPPLTNAAQDRLDELLQEEVGTAVANFDCNLEIETELAPILEEFEQQLLPVIEAAS